MGWIKLDDDTYAKEASPDPAVIISLSELQKEIEDLQKKIAEEKSKLIDVDKLDGVLKEAAIEWNSTHVETNIAHLELQLQEKQEILDEIWQ